MLTNLNRRSQSQKTELEIAADKMLRKFLEDVN